MRALCTILESSPMAKTWTGQWWHVGPEHRAFLECGHADDICLSEPLFVAWTCPCSTPSLEGG